MLLQIIALLFLIPISMYIYKQLSIKPTQTPSIQTSQPLSVGEIPLTKGEQQVKNELFSLFYSYWSRLFGDKINLFIDNINIIVEANFQKYREELLQNLRPVKDIINPIEFREKQMFGCMYITYMKYPYDNSNPSQAGYPDDVINYVKQNIRMGVFSCSVIEWMFCFSCTDQCKLDRFTRAQVKPTYNISCEGECGTSPPVIIR